MTKQSMLWQKFQHFYCDLPWSNI